MPAGIAPSLTPLPSALPGLCADLAAAGGRMLTLFGAEHILGGVSGYDAAETSDENPERVATLRALAWAYLRTTLYPGDSAWAAAVAALESTPDPIGRVDSK